MKRVILIVLDGWGWSKEKTGNAILAAQTPNLDNLKKNYPFFLLQASGSAVGLPPLKEGNSEVGHLTLGAGRIVLQHLTLINQAIKNGSFFDNETFRGLIEHVKSRDSRLHLMGLLTSGTVHASLEHLLALIAFFKTKMPQIPVFLHLFTDGKDSGKKESVNLIKEVESQIVNSNIKIATLVGRDFAMDRDNNWKMTQKAYELLVRGRGEKSANPGEILRGYHNQDVTDEIMPPILIDPMGLIKENDGVLFFNFREDSAKQLAKAFVEESFNFFETEKFNNLFFTTMTNYGDDLKAGALFKREEIKNTLGEVLENASQKQLRLAETIKSAHVTYFFNGLKEKPFDNEVDVLIPSLENPLTNPEMRLQDLAAKTIEELRREKFNFILVNFANPDILSHTGNFEAAVKGIGAVDQAIGRIYEECKKTDAALVITGDHGNAENLTYAGTGEKETKHNLNPVPFYLIAKEFNKEKNDAEISREEKEVAGMLQDVTPIILKLVGLPKPPEMTGISLINSIKDY